MRIHLNDYVKVRLTDHGRDIYYHQYDGFNKWAGKEYIKPRYPDVDDEGYTEFQLWELMYLYGKHMEMGKPIVFEPLEIVYVSESLAKRTIVE